MEKTLKTLQALQVKAHEKGIHSFTINAREFGDNERGIIVSIFLRGDETDEDYLNVPIYEKSNPKFRIMEVAEFIGEEVPEV